MHVTFTVITHRDGVLEESFVRSGRYSSALIEAIARMVHPDPSQRPSAAEVAHTAGGFLHSHRVMAE